MRYRLLPVAQEEIHAIWLYIATQSGSVEIADRQIDMIKDFGPLILRVARGSRDLKQLLIN